MPLSDDERDEMLIAMHSDISVVKDKVVTQILPWQKELETRTQSLERSRSHAVGALKVCGWIGSGLATVGTVIATLWPRT